MPLARITVDPVRVGQPRAWKQRSLRGSTIDVVTADEMPVDEVLGAMPVDEVLGEHPDLRAGGFAESQRDAAPASGFISAPAMVPDASPASGIASAPGSLPSLSGASQ